MESSKTTARHIRQVAGDLQAAQINLMCYQCTELLAGKDKRRKPVVKQRQPYPKNADKQASSQFKRNDVLNVVILLTNRYSSAQQEDSSASHAISLVTIQASVSKEASTSKWPSRPGHLKHTDSRQVHCMHKIVAFEANLKSPVQKILSAFN